MLLNFLCRNSGFFVLLLEELISRIFRVCVLFDLWFSRFCWTLFQFWMTETNFASQSTSLRAVVGTGRLFWWKVFPSVARLERQPVYLSIGEICCQAIFLFFSEFFLGCFLSEILQFYFWSLYFVDFKSISYNLFLRESFKPYPNMKYRHFIFSLLHYPCYDSYDFLFCFSGLNDFQV